MTFNNARYGNLPASGVKVLNGNELQLPATLTLTSADAGKKIEISGNGTDWLTPTYDATVGNEISVSIKSPIKVYRFTGASGDAYNVL